MSKKRFIISIVCLILVGWGLTTVFVYKSFYEARKGRDDIFTYVKDNRQSLLENIQQSGMKKKNLKEIGRIEKSNIQEINQNTLSFRWESSGIAPAGFERGFYYTADNTPACGVIWIDEELSQDGQGYSWKESDGDNSYYTEKICDNFFYYEASN